MMFWDQSNVFFLKITSKALLPKVVAIVTILVSHGETIMENIKNAGKDTVPIILLLLL